MTDRQRYEYLMNTVGPRAADDFAEEAERRLEDEQEEMTRCESGWTGDRCVFDLGHEGPHSND